MIRAANPNKDGIIGIESLTALCENIGASDTVSREDIQQIINELGDGSNSTIEVDQVLKRVL